MPVLLFAKELYDIRNNAKKKANGEKIRMYFSLVCFIRSPAITDNKTVRTKQKFLTQTLVKVNGVKSEKIEMQINIVSTILKPSSIFTLKILMVIFNCIQRPWLSAPAASGQVVLIPDSYRDCVPSALTDNRQGLILVRVIRL